MEVLPRLTGRQVIFDPIPARPKEVKENDSQIECLSVFCKAPQRYQTTVKSVCAGDDGALKEITVIRLEPVHRPDGRTEMEEVPGTEERLPCEMLIIAAGFLGPERYVAEALGVETTPRSNIATERYATNVPDIFACGDCRTGQSLVVKAMADGRECAKAVDEYLNSGA